MRERTLGLSVQGGDRVSAEFLAHTLYKRAQSLADDPHRAVLRPHRPRRRRALLHRPPARQRRGRRPDGRRLAAPTYRRAFYRASRTEPMGVELRRRFGFQHGALTAYEDEPLTDATGTTAAARSSTREIERPRVGPMRDIVATIQPEQDVIVRSDLATSVCVQGAPGTGKTAVGLHRAAFLLYATATSSPAQGVLVVGPNALVPALHRRRAARRSARSTRSRPRSRTWSPRRCPGRTRGTPVRGADATRDVAVLKGDARLATVAAPGAVVARADARPRGCVRAARRPTLAARAVRGGGDRRPSCAARGVRYGAARGMLAQRLAHAHPGEDGGRRRLPRRPGAGRGGAQPRGAAGTSTRCGRRSTRHGWCCGCSADADFLADARRRRARRRRAGAAALGKPARAPGVRAVVARRRGADRRGGRPGRAHPVSWGTSSPTRRRTSRR